MKEPKKWVTKHKVVLAWRWWSDGDPEPARLLAGASAAEREGDGDCLILTRADGTMAMHSGDLMVRFDDGYAFAIPAQAFMRLFDNGVARIEPLETRSA